MAYGRGVRPILGPSAGDDQWLLASIVLAELV
jgi:hypothetical protein